MHNREQVFLTLLENSDCLASVQKLPVEDLAFVYTNAAYLSAAIEYLREQLWLQEDLHLLAEPHLHPEFAQIPFLHSWLSGMSEKKMKDCETKAAFIETHAIEVASKLDPSGKKCFAKSALQFIKQFFLHEEALQDRSQLQNPHIGPRLYRCFDLMDDFIGLDYSADWGMKTDLTSSERLYEGAGIGVQSGYSTVLLALHSLRQAQHIVDLGSGYGRVGLIVGLLRPEIKFTGYEYVDHRVQIANKAASEFAVQNKVQFFTQDLSDKNFQIPVADVYYLYDPFSAETYHYVLLQLIRISRTQPITIVTKGNARGWLMDIAQREGWAAPLQIDGGNLCLFESGNSQLALANADQPVVHLL